MTPRRIERAGKVRATPRPRTLLPGEEAVDHETDDDAATEAVDAVDEAGAESFPASDAPQWWSGTPDTHG